LLKEAIYWISLAIIIELLNTIGPPSEIKSKIMT